MVKKHVIVTGGLVALAVLSGIILTNPLALADDSHIDTMSVSVPESCTLTSSGVNSHNAEINNGQTNDQIGTTTVKIFCNDNTGYALYAIGYTDNEYGKNVLVNSAIDSSYDIATAATITTGTSSWAMKLTKTGSSYLPIIAGSTDDTNKQTGDPDFSGFAAVPAEYTKVAYYLNSTDMGATASGSNLTTTYRAYISPTQPAGTYVGQVKYTLVHPSTAGKPVAPLKASDCPAGYVCYAPNANDIVGSMDSISNDTITSSPTAGKISVGTSAATINLIAPNYKREGYGFAGWSTSFDATTATNPVIYGPNETITVNLSASGLILYPVWVENAGNLQGWNGCNSLTTAPTNTRATLSSVTALTDTRDGNTYAVARLADGKCWMIENLRLDDSTTLTVTNTHDPLHDTNNTVTLKTNYVSNAIADHLAASNNTWCTSLGTSCTDQTMLNTNNTRISDSNLTTSYNADETATSKWYSYGNYYNWYSATAGNGTYSFNTKNNSVTGDLCPAGWHLPKGGDKNNTANSEFWALSLALIGVEPSNTSSSNYPANYTGASEGGNASKAFRAYPNNFINSGLWEGNQAYSRSSGGRYWSSSVYTNNSSYSLSINDTSVYPGTDFFYKYYGLSVRCIAQ